MVSRFRRLVTVAALVMVAALQVNCGDESKGTGGGGSGGGGGDAAGGGAGGSN